MPDSARFDAAYFERFYGSTASRDAVSRQAGLSANLCASAFGLLDLPLCSIADVGCGPGPIKAAFAAIDPTIDYAGFDASEFACAQFGWTLFDLRQDRLPEIYDLVICESVLQYLDANSLVAALTMMMRATRAGLFLRVPTASDFARIICADRTDMQVERHPAALIQGTLAPEFWHFGGGLFVRRDAPAFPYELWIEPLPSASPQA